MRDINPLSESDLTKSVEDSLLDIAKSLNSLYLGGKKVKWSDLVVYDSDGELYGYLDDPEIISMISQEKKDGRILFNRDGSIKEWHDFFIAESGEEPSWDTPKRDVDWSGFLDAIKSFKSSLNDRSSNESSKLHEVEGTGRMRKLTTEDSSVTARSMQRDLKELKGLMKELQGDFSSVVFNVEKLSNMDFNTEERRYKVNVLNGQLDEMEATLEAFGEYIDGLRKEAPYTGSVNESSDGLPIDLTNPREIPTQKKRRPNVWIKDWKVVPNNDEELEAVLESGGGVKVLVDSFKPDSKRFMNESRKLTKEYQNVAKLMLTKVADVINPNNLVSVSKLKSSVPKLVKQMKQVETAQVAILDDEVNEVLDKGLRLMGDVLNELEHLDIIK